MQQNGTNAMFYRYVSVTPPATLLAILEAQKYIPKIFQGNLQTSVIIRFRDIADDH